jgi:hypothetical protein
MIIAGLIGEAIAIVLIPSGTFEKTVSVVCTLIIALGVWIEEIGGDAAEARESAETDLKLAELNARAAEAQLETERIKAENLSIQRIIRPRRLPTGGAFTEKYDELAKFADTLFVVYVVPDFEAQLFARDIWNVLARAGWKPDRDAPIINSTMFDGVLIFAGDPESWPPPPKKPDRAWDAGAALGDLMNVWKLGLQGTWPVSHTVEIMLPIEFFPRSNGAVAVTVGMRDIDTELKMLHHFGPPPTGRPEPLVV